jgi:hypothetical protein
MRSENLKSTKQKKFNKKILKARKLSFAFAKETLTKISNVNK